jgi:hypothetical protein
MEMSKLLRFWAACQLGEGDYLSFRDREFAGETVDSLYDKIKAHADRGPANSGAGCENGGPTAIGMSPELPENAPE